MGLLDDLQKMQFGIPLAQALRGITEAHQTRQTQEALAPIFQQFQEEIDRTGDEQELDLLDLSRNLSRSLGQAFQADPEGRTQTPQQMGMLADVIMQGLSAEQQRRMSEAQIGIAEQERAITEEFGMERVRQQIEHTKAQIEDLKGRPEQARQMANLQQRHRKELMVWEHLLRKDLESMRLQFQMSGEVAKINEDMYSEIFSHPATSEYLNMLGTYFRRNPPEWLPDGVPPTIQNIYFRQGYPDLTRMSQDITSMMVETGRVKEDDFWETQNEVLSNLQSALSNKAQEASDQLDVKLFESYQGNIIAQQQMTFEEYRNTFLKTRSLPFKDNDRLGLGLDSGLLDVGEGGGQESDIQQARRIRDLENERKRLRQQLNDASISESDRIRIGMRISEIDSMIGSEPVEPDHEISPEVLDFFRDRMNQ